MIPKVTDRDDFHRGHRGAHFNTCGPH
jgi:hypothetical protein